jgi:hypothetical protein
MFLEDKPGDAADTRRPRSATTTTRRTTGA